MIKFENLITKGLIMQKQTRQVFDKDFKINTVKLITGKEKRISELSGELGISENTLHNWKMQYLKDAEKSFPGKGHKSPIEEDWTTLRRAKKVIEEERDILKKSLIFFAKDATQDICSSGDMNGSSE